MTTIALPRAVLPRAMPLPLNWLASLLFASFVAFMPWELIRGAAFADLANYSARMFQIADNGMDYFEWEDSLVGWLKFEYFWFRMLAAAAYLDVEPLHFMKAVTFASAFMTHRFLAARVGAALAFVVLANPISIDLLSSQTRSAFAFALFLTIADLLVARKHLLWRWASFSALPFVHTAMIPVLSIYALSTTVAGWTRLSPLLKASIAAGAGIVFCLAIVVALPGFAESVGDRRDLAGYENKTLTYLSFWFLAAGALAISYGREACARWEYLFALFVCVSAPAIEATGTPGFRFVALALPLVWIALGFTTGWTRRAAFAGAAAYGLLLVYYWVR